MQMPSTHDTIVAVSSGWLPRPVGILRLSGPESVGLADSLGVKPTCPAVAARPLWTSGRLALEGGESLPVTAMWFRAPRSYTGQDVVELHTVGCLPLLRELAARLIELGARRALPGEFTARAFVNGRLTAAQVEGVLALMQAEHAASVRQAARLVRGSNQHVVENSAERILRLLASVEAGIDFVDEENVRFITAPEAVRQLDALLADLESADRPERSDLRLGRPHVALAGLRNAGKSTLFNCLVGHERALVSPVLGTTRDVLSAEVELGGVTVVLQDCAGVGDSTDELELACHLASERAAQEADLVVWVHAADTTWDGREAAACARIAPERRLLVTTKLDLARAGTTWQAPISCAGSVQVSATTGMGIALLRKLLADLVGKMGALRGEAFSGGELRAAAAALRRARAVAASSDDDLPSPELMSLELRAAYELLSAETHGAIDERLLDRIFAAFCVGK